VVSFAHRGLYKPLDDRVQGGKAVSTDSSRQDPERPNYQVLGFSLGMIFGVALGLTLAALTHKILFFAVFTGAGMSLGLAIGADLERRHAEKDT
jgi:hypothetical protein